ncbi:hypothetical protein Tco_1106387 [Tanacetum coccineum]
MEVGVSRSEVEDMVRCMECSVRELSLTYLGLPIGWRARIDHEAKSFKVIKSIYGADGPMGDVVGLGGVRSEVWGNIVRVGRDIDRLGVCFSSSFTRKVGDGSRVSFWDDRWVRGDWVRESRGRVVDELVGLEEFLSHVKLTLNGMDTWNWELDEDGVFLVKRLSSVVATKCLNVGVANFETVWNKLIPKKVTKDGSDENLLKHTEKRCRKLQVIGVQFCVDRFVMVLPIYRSLFRAHGVWCVLWHNSTTSSDTPSTLMPFVPSTPAKP